MILRGIQALKKFENNSFLAIENLDHNIYKCRIIKLDVLYIPVCTLAIWYPIFAMANINAFLEVIDMFDKNMLTTGYK